MCRNERVGPGHTAAMPPERIGTVALGPLPAVGDTTGTAPPVALGARRGNSTGVPWSDRHQEEPVRQRCLLCSPRRMRDAGLRIRVIATLLSFLSIAPRHCARWTYFFHPKLREISALLITLKLITLTLQRLRRSHRPRPCHTRHTFFACSQTAATAAIGADAAVVC